MKNFFKGTLLAGALLAGTSSFAQIQDENNVTITMELVPILQLNMNTPDQVNFVFDEIAEYIGGITQYGGTILTVSSTVSWDLFASGTSGAHNVLAANSIWDFQVGYGAAVAAVGGAQNDLPLRALELHQFPSDINGNAAIQVDYGTVFAPVATPAFTNNVYVSLTSPYAAPLSVVAEQRYIAGGFGTANFVAGGSYLTQAALAANGASAGYYFVVDYRIVPGLPASFPHASNGASASAGTAFIDAAIGEYAMPGVYTMNVKYLLIENQ